MITIIICLLVALVGAQIYKEIANDIPTVARRVFLSIILVLFFGGAALMLKSIVVPCADQVATIYANADHDQKSIFKEKDTGKYFILMEDLWNPWNVTYREYLDAEVVEEYIAKYNELKEFETRIK